MTILIDEIADMVDEDMQCLIVDDDPLICDLLSHFCSKTEAITSVTMTNSGFESVNLINRQSFDLILLDYNLPDITGKEILQLIGAHTAVIMITANKNFASESYDYDQIVDFLVKPIDFPRFFKGIRKVQKFHFRNQEKESVLFIKEGNKLVKIEPGQILFIRSAANYVEIVFDQKKILALMTMKDLETKLPGYFQRVHRSYIVNINKIDTITQGEAVVREMKIPVSDSYEKELFNKINLLN